MRPPVLVVGLVLLGLSFAPAQNRPDLPAFRVQPEGWGLKGTRDIEKILGSAARQLWPHFPDYGLEPMVVVRGKNGPITLFKRNLRGEIIVELDTGETYWSQYAYQFAHEFCHVLCGFKEGGREHKWFEESLCELASIYTMHRMAEEWEKKPPYPNWKGYAKSLRKYADDVIKKREPLEFEGLSKFYASERESLRRNPTQRDKNGRVAVALLPLFEERPERWEAVRWLNANRPEKGASFGEFLRGWHDAAPERHREFIKTLAEAFR